MINVLRRIPTFISNFNNRKKKNETNQLNCQLLLLLSKIKYLIQNTNTDIEILNTNDDDWFEDLDFSFREENLKISKQNLNFIYKIVDPLSTLSGASLTR